MKTPKRYFLLLAAIPFLLFSCKDESPASLSSADSLISQVIPADHPADVFNKVLTRENLPTQEFRITSSKDTIITGMHGTRLRVNRNLFVGPDGKPVSGAVDVELKEALQMSDIVLANLVTVTAGGEMLETGGMICVTATSGGQTLRLADGKTIEAAVPVPAPKKNMQLYEGKIDSANKIAWDNPAPLEKEEAQPADDTPADKGNWVHWSNLDDASLSLEKKESISNEVTAKWMGFHRDTVVKIQGARIRFFSKNSDIDFDAFDQPDPQLQPRQVQLPPQKQKKGVNTFLADANTNYVFALKSLGWANIDRLAIDPRTTDVNFVTNISNQADFSLVYVTLIVGNQNMFIPGYQKSDGTFSFTHGDFEKPRLPVGEEAIILATAYKNGKPFYIIEPIMIMEEMNFTFRLRETTPEKLKTELEAKI